MKGSIVLIDLIFKTNILHFLEINTRVFLSPFFETLKFNKAYLDCFLKAVSAASTFSLLIATVLHKHSSGTEHFCMHLVSRGTGLSHASLP